MYYNSKALKLCIQPLTIPASQLNPIDTRLMEEGENAASYLRDGTEAAILAPPAMNGSGVPIAASTQQCTDDQYIIVQKCMNN